jgi:hypothetical protein
VVSGCAHADVNVTFPSRGFLCLLDNVRRHPHVFKDDVLVLTNAPLLGPLFSRKPSLFNLGFS